MMEFILSHRALIVFLGLFQLCCLPLFAQQAQEVDSWLYPKPLQPGDTIAFVAPAGIAESGNVVAYQRWLEKKGFRVRIAPDLFQRKDGYLAGTDKERVDEINRAIRDPEVRAIFPVRGGYGLTRILDRIDYRALRKDPKLIIGYSDLTALHLAVSRKAKVITYHAPMPSELGLLDKPEYDFARDSFEQLALRANSIPKGLEIPLPSKVKLESWVGGRSKGRLQGGNLSLICATMGTEYELDVHGAILFLEDVGEAPYRIDRMLSQLRLAGVFDRISGLLVGSFTTKEAKDVAEIDRVLDSYFRSLKCPVLKGFPVGHTPWNTTIPHGAIAEFDTDTGTLRILE